MVAMGMITETFETAVTWDRSDALDDAVLAAAEAGLRDAGAWPAIVTRRFTHVYADGPAPYYTVIAPGRRGSEIGQWDLAKTAVSDAIVASGGTITHHHAVGRDHRPWYDRERPDLFARGLGAAKAVLDPSWIMNPGVLVDPP
jgi:alkyldihydroxyacetonephosphate synthase